MLQVPVSAIPNQSFSLQLDQNTFDISLYTVGLVMAMDIAINSVPVLTGQRLVAGFPVIPYRYLENGNFIFSTMNDDLPDYTQFGSTQSFYYVSPTELEAIRAGT